MNKLAAIAVSVPHASTDVPDDIRPLLACDDRALRARADLYTDLLYDIPGTATVRAPYSRIITDVNRAPDDFSPEGHERTDGVVQLSFTGGGNVFKQDPSPDAMRDWIRRFHAPYHARLAEVLKDASFLLDGHSMRTKGSRPSANEAPRADIVLGNLRYAACAADVIEFFREHLERSGYVVAVNKPFAGRYILARHCDRDAKPGLQMEIRRGLYMHEKTLEPNERAIESIRDELRLVVSAFAEWHGQA